MFAIVEMTRFCVRLILAILLSLPLVFTTGGLQLGDKIIQIDSLDVVEMMRVRACDAPGTIEPGTSCALKLPSLRLYATCV